MSEEIKPKKERKFLKALGKIGEVLIQELFFRVGSNLIRKIGGKKPLPSILFLFLSLSLFAQFPNTLNKQRLGFQTTGDGLVWRGSISDTASIQPINNTSAWVILDTINLKFYTFDFTSNTWNVLPQGTNIDTTSLSNRIDLKLNISDTAAMLLPYATKIYVDTAGRFYARQDFINAQTSTLTWTQTDTLVPSGVNVIMVYRNGQILLPSQYTIPNKTTVIIAATSFKVGENYTVIFPKGGGGSGGSGGGGGGSGSVTSISQGTGIIVTPNPLVSTGSIAADLTVLMELNDTVSLSSRINTKLNATDTASLSSRINLKLTATDTASLSNRINLKLNATDTASLSNRIDAKGTGTVTSVATGYGLTGGTITTTGTLVLDSAVVFSRIRDSIVDVAIGNDTIKILKQEYAPATTSVLTWTITSKFPIQSKSFILVFRNGQLLINDQYNLTDTNKITIVSNSFKVGANYTVVTVSGIGSVGTGVFPNPVYPEAGIAVSTGSAWASSIANNSSNWNIAFNDKITNAQFTGTTTKTLTLTQYDGGTFTPTFTDLQGVTGVTAGTGLTGGTITSTGTVAVDFTTVAPLANPTFTGTVSGITKSMVGLGNVDNTSDANKPVSTATQTALNLKLNISDTAAMLTPYLRKADTTLLNLTSRFNTKLNLSDTSNMLVPYLRKADTTLMLSKYLRRADTSLLNLTSRFAAKLNISDTASMLTNYLRLGVAASTYLTQSNAASTYLPFTGGTLTGDLYAKYLNTFAKTTYIPYNAGIGEQSIFNVGTALRGGTVMVFPDSNLVGSSANIFLANSSVQGVESSAMGSGMRNYAKQGGDTRRNSLAFYTSGIGSQNTNRLFIDYDGNVGINDDTPSYKLEVNGTFNATGNITEAGNNVLTNLDTASLSNRIDSKFNSSGGTISGAVTLSTTTATPTSLLGKDGNNVVGTVTAVAQTGLMTRGETTATTGSPSATFTVTHGLGFNPTAVLVTSAGIGGGDKIIFEVYTKNSTTFSVQAWNYDGTEASGKTVKIYWLALK